MAFANVAIISEGKEIAFLMMLSSQKFQLSAKQAGESKVKPVRSQVSWKNRVLKFNCFQEEKYADRSIAWV